ncbi:MAG: hypothetical protein VB859_08015, partial [Planctomycetaceae bacterium]
MTHIAKAVEAIEEDPADPADPTDPAEPVEGVDPEAALEVEEVEALTATGSAAERDRVLTRMQREIARSISGSRTLQPLERVLVAGYDMPGLTNAEIMEVPVEELTGLPDTGSYSSRCAASYGAAVGQLGGGLMSQNLRKEELRFTGTLERLELPLAVAALLLLTFLGVWNIGLNKEYQKVNQAVSYWRDTAVKFMIPTNMEDAGNLDPPPKWIVDYSKNFTGRTLDNQFRTDPVRTSYEQMTYLRARLRQEVLSLKRELGQGGDFEQPQSALKGATYVLDVLDNTREKGARPSIRSIKSTYNRGNNTTPDNVTVTMDVTFFAEDTATGTEHFEAFRSAIESHPWHIGFNPARTDPLENGEGITVERITIKMDVSKTEEASS